MKERTAEPGCCQCRYKCAVLYGVSAFGVIVILADNQIPRRLSIDVLAISGVSVMVALVKCKK